MKKTFAAALIIAASVTLFSCDWFSSKKTNYPLLGKWRVDSFDSKQDSGKASLNFVGLLLVAAQSKDSVKMEYDFSQDTVSFQLTKNEIIKAPYEFNKDKQELLIKDSVPVSMLYAKVNDSTIALTSTDSSTVFLRKIK